MPPFPRSRSELEHKLAHQTLQAVRLGHVAQVLLATGQPLSVFTNGADDVVLEVVSAAMTGCSSAQLTRLFADDQDLPFIGTFDHPYFEPLKAWGMEDLPLYDEDVSLDALFDPDGPVQAEDRLSRTQVLARTGTGEVAGFLEFSLRYAPAGVQSVFHAANVRHIRALDAQAFKLTLTLERLYVRKLYRHQRVGTCLLAVAADMLKCEVIQIAHQLLSAYRLLERPFVCVPAVATDWNSKTGLLADSLLKDLAALELSSLSELHREFPALACCEVLAVQSEVA